MPPRFSHSRLAAFENCPRQYQYRYVDRLPRPGPGIEAFMGICVHAALEYLYSEIHAGRPVPDRDSVLSFFLQKWSEVPAATLRIVRRGFDIDDYQALGQHCLATYYDSHQPFAEGTIMAVEKKVEFALDRAGRYPMVGYIDRLMKTADGIIEIHDYKTSGSLPRERDLREDRQLTLYEIAVRDELGVDEDTQFVHIWHYLTFQRIFEKTRSLEDRRGVARKTLAGIRKVLAAQEFPARTGVLCHWCDFNEHCPEGAKWVANKPRPGLPVTER